MRHLILIVFVILLLSVSLFTIQPVEAQKSAKETVATGNGFSLTNREVDQITELLTRSTQNRPSSRNQAVMTSLRYKLMALEMADPPDEANSQNPDTVLTLAQQYMEKILEKYPVSDKVIESYYIAHPEIYQPPEKEAVPLNDEVIRGIRQKIVEKKRKNILDEAVENLMKKYNVSVYNNP